MFQSGRVPESPVLLACSSDNEGMEATTRPTFLNYPKGNNPFLISELSLGK
jgi:hypothetical protein